MGNFRILIADDHVAIRRNLRSLLESHADWEVSGEAANGREAVEQWERLQPDLVITDFEMPELNGLETIRQIRARDSDSSIVVLTMYDTPEIVAQLRNAGAAAVVAKSDASERLVPMIHAVQRHRGWFAGSIVPRPRHALAFFPTNAEADEVLLPFIREGVVRGERVLRIVDAHDLERDASVDGIEVAPFDSIVVGDRGLEPESVLARVAAILRDSASRGFPLTRVIGETAWMKEHNPDFLVLESGFNDLMKDFDDVVVCGYDLTRFSSAMVIDCLRVHPLVLVGGALRQNPFFDA